MKLLSILFVFSFILIEILALPIEKRGYSDHMQVNFYWDGGCKDYAYEYKFISQAGNSYSQYNKCISFNGNGIWSAGLVLFESPLSKCFVYTDSKCNNLMNVDHSFIILDTKGQTSNPTGACKYDGGQHIGSIKCFK